MERVEYIELFVTFLRERKSYKEFCEITNGNIKEHLTRLHPTMYLSHVVRYENWLTGLNYWCRLEKEWLELIQ